MNIYFAKDKTPEYKYTVVGTADTTAVWTPDSGKRLVITGLNLYNAAAAQAFTFYLGSTNGAPAAFLKFAVGASASINFELDPIDAKIEDYVLYVVGSGTGATNGQAITVTGFQETL